MGEGLGHFKSFILKIYNAGEEDERRVWKAGQSGNGDMGML
jgi:hypothetical protein